MDDSVLPGLPDTGHNGYRSAGLFGGTGEADDDGGGIPALRAAAAVGTATTAAVAGLGDVRPGHLGPSGPIADE